MDAEKIEQRSGVSKEASRYDKFLLCKLEADILNCVDLFACEIGSNLDKPDCKDQWPIMVIRELDGLLAMCAFNTLLNVVRVEEELLWLHMIQPIFLPKLRVGSGECAPAIHNHFGNTFLLGDHLYSPT